MSNTPVYNKALINSARYGMKLREKCGDEDAKEIFEAWMTAGIAGLVDIIGWDAARDLLRHKLGEYPVPSSKPKLVIDNTEPQPDFAA